MMFHVSLCPTGTVLSLCLDMREFGTTEMHHLRSHLFSGNAFSCLHRLHLPISFKCLILKDISLKKLKSHTVFDIEMVETPPLHNP